jgi:hypothetical protein
MDGIIYHLNISLILILRNLLGVKLTQPRYLKRNAGCVLGKNKLFVAPVKQEPFFFMDYMHMFFTESAALPEFYLRKKTFATTEQPTAEMRFFVRYLVFVIAGQAKTDLHE